MSQTFLSNLKSPCWLFGSSGRYRKLCLQGGNRNRWAGRGMYRTLFYSYAFYLHKNKVLQKLHLLFIYFMPRRVCLHISMHTTCVPDVQRGQKRRWRPWKWSYRQLEPLCGSQELRPGPLQEYLSHLCSSTPPITFLIELKRKRYK